MITCCAQNILDMDEDLSQCDHKWKLVYYGSEPDVECEHCKTSISEIMSDEDAHPIIRSLFNE